MATDEATRKYFQSNLSQVEGEAAVVLKELLAILSPYEAKILSSVPKGKKSALSKVLSRGSDVSDRHVKAMSAVVKSRMPTPVPDVAGDADPD